MTILQVINSLFYIIIYPYLIRTLGAESYGLYIYALSVATYFIFLINFGFDFPGTKAVAQYRNEHAKLENTFSCIFTAKLYLQIIAGLIFMAILYTIPFLRNNYIVFLLVFLQTFSHLFVPVWYYQGLQRMKRLTMIQVIFKFLSLPAIFFLVKTPKDTELFALINAVFIVSGGLVSFIAVPLIDKVKIKLVKFGDLKIWFKDSFPFFLSNSVGVIKEQSITIIIGAFFGMRDVAIYDLANKVITIPRTLLMSINAALFPKIVVDTKKYVIKKIIKYEFLIGVSVGIFVVLFGKWIIHLLGGQIMSESYPMAIILSVTVISWLVVGAYISFVFIPNYKYYIVTKNQIVALVSLAIFVSVGLLIEMNIFVLVGGLAFSGIIEMVYCFYQTKKHKLL